MLQVGPSQVIRCCESAAIIRPESWTRNMYYFSDCHSHPIFFLMRFPFVLIMIYPRRLCAVMAQILSIYGLVTSVIISNNLFEKMALYTAFIQMGAGLAVGFAIGIAGDAGGNYRCLFLPRIVFGPKGTRCNRKSLIPK